MGTAIAAQYPQYAQQITDAARISFLQGDRWAYTAGLVAVLIRAALVFVFFPEKGEETGLLRATRRPTDRGPPHPYSRTVQDTDESAYGESLW